MKKLIKTSLLVIAISVFSTFAAAQGKMSEEKRKLIADVISTTRADQQFLDIFDKMLESMEKTYPKIVSQTLENDPKLSAAERKQIIDSLAPRVKLFSQKFRERLPQKIDSKKFIEELIYPLYDKYFTEKELSDLLVFYKSETGRKFISVTPQLVADSGEITEKVLLPQILVIVEDVMKEVFPELGGKSSSPPPPPAPAEKPQKKN